MNSLTKYAALATIGTTALTNSCHRPSNIPQQTRTQKNTSEMVYPKPLSSYIGPPYGEIFIDISGHNPKVAEHPAEIRIKLFPAPYFFGRHVDGMLEGKILIADIGVRKETLDKEWELYDDLHDAIALYLKKLPKSSVENRFSWPPSKNLQTYSSKDPEGYISIRNKR